VCPVNCIPVNPQWVEDKDSLWRKYRRLQRLAANGSPASASAGSSENLRLTVP
jgi:hypothetical protein